LKWALQADSTSIRESAWEVKTGKLNKLRRRVFSIWVRPHPFIQNGITNARRKLPATLKNVLERPTL
jgi:hypothetical protein